MGKGKAPGTSAEDAHSHQSAPLSTLKDPTTFGPPPRHVNRAEVQPPASGSRPTKSYTTASAVAFPESEVLATAPKGDSWGTPLPQATLEAKQQQEQQQEEEEEVVAATPSLPYRADTTGLSTSGLPPPPVKREPPVQEAAQPVPKAAPRAVPKPPPRLPPRQNSNPDEFSQPPPPPYTASTAAPTPPIRSQTGSSYINQGAANRLGAAGVSVPGFGIGRSSSSQSTTGSGATSPPPQQPAAPASGSQMSELQARFNKLPGRVSSPTAQSPQAAGSARGTTWQQKQAALTTANKFQKDPSSVTLSDAKEAGGTMNNFRQRHGEQVAQGWQQAQGLDKKYGVSGKVGGLAQGQAQEPPQAAVAAESTVNGSATSSAPTIAGKKPPPPPPKKKAGLAAGPAETEGAPPPIPHSSKPRQ